jgi:hypothetical protein
MTQSMLDHCLQHELQHQFRKRVTQEIRDHCPDDDPMVSGVTVMLGSVLAMAVFYSLMSGSRGRGR